MIINGKSAGSVGFWSSHLQREDTNDRAEVMEISGLLSTNLESALREMQAIAGGSRCGENFMYQANINPRDNERLTPEQWKQAVDTLEKKLGLEGHQRVVVEHEKEGRVHRHVIWNRVDVDTLRTAPMRFNYYEHERTARELEEKLGLSQTKSLHGERRPEGRPERPSDLWERNAAAKTGIDPQDIKAELTDLWRKTDSGKAFAAALEERGYILAQGDRRDFCVVDHAGTAHSPARRVEGVKAKDVKERFADIDRATLPTVAEARAVQSERHQTPELAKEAWEEREKGGRDSSGAARDAAQPEPAAAKAHDDRPEARHPSYAPEPEKATEEKAKGGERWHNRDATKIEEKIFKIQDAAERGGSPVAAGLYAEGITLARVDGAAKQGIERDYQRQFENAKHEGKEDARLRHATFKEGELVAVTRYGDVHRLNPRFIDSEKLERAATGGREQTPTLSAAREHFATERQQSKDDRATARETIKEAAQTQRGRGQTAHDIKGAAQNVKDAGLKVVTAAGSVSSLASFLESALFSTDSGAEPVYENQQERTLAALDDIYESLQAGRNINAQSIRDLPPAHIDNLRKHGDAYILDMILDLERERAREQDYGREREQ